jgi:hypothetical protein
MVHFLGKKLENRLLHGVIMWFFVGGSEFRAHWHDWIIDSCRARKVLSECIQMSNTLKAKYALF